jgi:uncharacterized membrane protein YhaH (DUF805 family)
MTENLKLSVMFKNPFSFEGRIRRTEYGLSFIILVVGRVFLAMLLGAASNGEDLSVVYLMAQLPLLWFFWAQGAKRCHDIGMSGWYQLIPFLPIYLIFGSGVEGPTKYGEDPKQKPSNF